MSTEIKTFEGRYEAASSTFEPYYLKGDLHLTRFYGGPEKGRMLQLTINTSQGIAYLQFTKDQIKELAKALNESFNDIKYPSE